MTQPLTFRDENEIRESAEKLQAERRVQITNIFEDEDAERIFKALDEEIDWLLTFKTSRGPGTLTPQQIQQLDPQVIQQAYSQIHDLARENFAYLYSTYPMEESKAGTHVVHPALQAVHDLLNKESTLELFRELSGHDDIRRATCHASLYGPDQFVNSHDDISNYESEKRRMNFIFGFTKGWRPDWGGYLNYYDEKGNVEHGFMPMFNVITTSLLPADHGVTYVPPFVGANRYSIAGWFCA